MGSPSSGPSRWRRAAIGLWTSAFATFAVVWLFVATLVLSPPGSFDFDTFFRVFPPVAAIPLGLAIAGTVIARRIGAPMRLYGIAIGLLAMSVVLAGLGSAAWFSIPSCGGGLSGPCFSPLFICGGGLVFALVGIVLGGLGVRRLRRIP